MGLVNNIKRGEIMRTHPSMFIKHPRGLANFAIVTGTPLSSVTLIVTGNVAALLAVPHAVIQAGLHLNQNVYGFRLVTAKKIMGRMMKRCRTMPTRVPPIRMPRLRPIVLISRRMMLARMR